MLFLHGGPGSFEALFAYELDEAGRHVHPRALESARSRQKLRRNKGIGFPETVGQMLDDLHGVIGHLRQKYQIPRVVLLGHSWGSLLGSLYVLRHPEQVSAYAGAGQVVSMLENERTAYREALEAARHAGNKKHMRALEKLGDYLPSNPELRLKALPKMRKIQEACDHDPVSGSGLGEMLKTIRRSPSFQWSVLCE